MPSTQDVIATIEKYSAHHYQRFPGVALARAKGTWVWDMEGRRYLDMFGAYSALSVGHNHPEIKKVMAQDYPIASHGLYTAQEAGFLEALCRVSGMEAALPMNSGVEAVETALKLARKWGHKKKGIPFDRVPKIIVAENNFHGRTITVVGFSSTPQYRDAFGPHASGFLRVPYGNTAAIVQAIKMDTAAVLLEPIQGEGGVVIPPRGYLAAVREACRRENVLLMLDEVQTGLGRTGKMFCFQYEEDVTPDVLIVGKALGGGQYPISAALAARELMDTFVPGDHGSTWGGNALACAIAQKTIQLLEQDNSDLVRRSFRLGADLLYQLRRIDSPFIKEVRGRGLLIGIELAPGVGSAFGWCRALLARGVICGASHERVIRISPPLVITQEEINMFLSIFRGVANAVSQK